MIPPTPPNERQRLEALYSYDLLDTAAEQSFDDLTYLASLICGTPVALVSLVDAQRQWFKSKVGWEIEETSRDVSFCAHAIVEADDLFVVPDTLDDERFATNPLVASDPQFRFYAGMPLLTQDGYALGTLCVIDYDPKVLDDKQTKALRALGRQVVDQIELRRHLVKREQAEKSLTQREERTRHLFEITAHTQENIDEQLDKALALATDLLDLEIGIISHIEDETYTIDSVYAPEADLQRGQQFNLGDTYCSLTRQADDVVTIDQAQGSEYQRHPCYQLFRLESYIGTPFWVRGQRYGTLNFSSSKPKTEPFSQADKDFVELLARWIGSALEQKQAQHELYTVAEVQKAILDNAEYSIISTTPEGIIQTFNPAAERMLGYRAEEVIGQESLMLIHDLSEIIDRAQLFSAELGTFVAPDFDVFAMKAARNLSNQYEWSYVRRDQTRLPVQVSITALRDEAGTITGYLSIAQDITRRKQSEATLAKRADELAMVADISTHISRIIDPARMLQTVVDLTKNNFDLYHVHIYLLDEVSETLTLTAGAGQVGRDMVAQGWQIALDADSLVAQAARERRGVIANNVRESPHFLPNPLLPNTRSELAVPIIVGDRLLGVLDVQADSLNRFTPEDVRIKKTLAAQVAVALENARQFERSEQAIQELDALTQRLTGEGWRRYREAQMVKSDYIYRSGESPEAETAAPQPQATQIETPLLVRGESIGMFAIDDPRTDAVDAQNIIEAVSRQLSAHIDNLRLTEQTQTALAETEKQAHRLAILNEMAAALGQATTETEIFDVVATKAAQIVGSDRLSVALVNGDVLKVVVLDGAQGAIPTGTTLPLAGTAVGKAVLEKRLLTSADTTLDDFADYRRLRAQGMQDILLAPLVTTRGQVIGTLNISSEEIEAYGQRDENLWRQVAALLASTLENRWLLAQTQDALEEATIFRQFVEAAGQGAGLATLEGEIKYVNPALAELLGVPDADTAVDHSIMDYYPEDLHPLLINEALPTVMSEGQWSSETRLISTQGEETAVIETFFLIRDKEEQPLYLANIATDITQRRQTEAELRKLSQAVEQSPNVVVITDTQGTIEYVNPKFMELTGYGMEEVLGKNPRLLKSGQVTTETYNQMWQTIRAGQTWRGEIVNRKKNGELYWASASISPITDRQGNITHFVALQEDITQRKAAEAERERLLAEVQASYRQYVRREWSQFLGDRHGGQWHIEHQRVDPTQTSAANGERGTSIAVPISVLGQVVGTFRLQDIDPNRDWSSEEVALVETVAEQLGLTIENLRLFESTQKQATREQLTRRITDKMRASPDIQAIIQSGLDELASALGVSRTYVKLVADPAERQARMSDQSTGAITEGHNDRSDAVERQTQPE